ncbi:MAG: hypothetical protein GEU77_03970 [Deltaproteobacteria bacterium]|nr:hypothetical protein [Deltaproteobacteria bacterium]
MKRSNTNTYEGQNWSWPQSTWLQKRLSAIKAEEEAARRKHPGVPEKPVASKAKSADIKASKDL